MFEFQLRRVAAAVVARAEVSFVAINGHPILGAALRRESGGWRDRVVKEAMTWWRWRQEMW